MTTQVNVNVNGAKAVKAIGTKANEEIVSRTVIDSRLQDDGSVLVSLSNLKLSSGLRLLEPKGVEGQDWNPTYFVGASFLDDEDHTGYEELKDLASVSVPMKALEENGGELQSSVFFKSIGFENGKNLVLLKLVNSLKDKPTCINKDKSFCTPEQTKQLFTKGATVNAVCKLWFSKKQQRVNAKLLYLQFSSPPKMNDFDYDFHLKKEGLAMLSSI